CLSPCCHLNVGLAVRVRATQGSLTPSLLDALPILEAGQRQSDQEDYPTGVRELACRDQQALLAQASQAGAAIGSYAERLLAGPLDRKSTRLNLQSRENLVCRLLLEKKKKLLLYECH